MSYLYYLLFALSPSIIWLLFYLRQDVHPESNRQIIKIFLSGMLIALPAIFLEVGLSKGLAKVGEVFNLSTILVSIFYIFFGVALVEEILKYLVFKLKVEKSSELDEPIDVMLYLIISGLGFAALENLLIFWPPQALQVFEGLMVSGLRFVGATFLHALCSGILGYFLALSFFEIKKKRRFFALGLTIAVFLHGLYNLSIMKIEGIVRFIIPAIIVVGLAIFLSFGIKKLKKTKSICKIK